MSHKCGFKMLINGVLSPSIFRTFLEHGKYYIKWWRVRLLLFWVLKRMDGFNSVWISDPSRFSCPGLVIYPSSLSSVALTPIFNFKGYSEAGEKKAAHFIAAQCFRVRQSAYSNCNASFYEFPPNPELSQ